MCIRQWVRTGIASVLLLGLAVLGPAPASANLIWSQQAILLIHVPLGGGLFFSTNHVITASQGVGTVNVRCFNESSQTIGPVAGVNVELNATGQLSEQTPTTLGVTTDPLFTGLGWCWANNNPNEVSFDVQTTIGSTRDLSPGGIVNSADSSLVAGGRGLGFASANRGAIPYFNTSGGAAATYVFLVNPRATSLTLTLQLYNAAGTAQGPALVRALAGRKLDVLSVPGVFGLATPPASGSISITHTGTRTNGYLGWIIQVGGGKNVFTPIDLLDAFVLTSDTAP